MSDTIDAVPSVIRRVEGDRAARLARLVGAYDELQTVLRCCERVLVLLDTDQGDGIEVEALWTLALLSYGRVFTEQDGAAPLTEGDLLDPDSDGEARRAHQVLMHLRDRHAHPADNPREVYSVGLAQDGHGAVNAIAVTSIGTPPVDAAAVRRMGSMTVPLCGLLDERIGAMQESLLAHVRTLSEQDVARLEVIEVAVGA